MTSVLLTEKPTQSQDYDTKKGVLNKGESKNKLLENLGWKDTKKGPLACITYPLTEKNNVGLIQAIIPGLLEQEIKIALMGIGSEKYQDFFTQLAENHPDRVVILEESEVNKEDLYAAADILICPGDSEEIQEAIEHALQNKVVPVSLEQANLVNYDPVQERGNAFIFETPSSWSLFATIIRALENFKFPYDWKNIQNAEL